jgi:hypothetical protein
MRRNFASAFAIAVASGGLFSAGCASAATNPAATGGTSEARTTAANGTVHFIGYSKNSDGPAFTVIVSGAIGDYGSAVTVRRDGTTDPEHSSELRLRLKHGSFRLNIARQRDQPLVVHSHLLVPRERVGADRGRGGLRHRLVPGDKRERQNDCHDR